MSSKAALEVRGLTMGFGGLLALDGINMKIDRGEIVALIGPNGAGKTTFFNCITGIYKPISGDVLIYPKEGKAKRVIDNRPKE